MRTFVQRGALAIVVAGCLTAFGATAAQATPMPLGTSQSNSSTQSADGGFVFNQSNPFTVSGNGVGILFGRGSAKGNTTTVNSGTSNSANGGNNAAAQNNGSSSSGSSDRWSKSSKSPKVSQSNDSWQSADGGSVVNISTPVTVSGNGVGVLGKGSSKDNDTTVNSGTSNSANGGNNAAAQNNGSSSSSSGKDKSGSKGSSTSQSNSSSQSADGGSVVNATAPVTVSGNGVGVLGSGKSSGNTTTVNSGTSNSGNGGNNAASQNNSTSSTSGSSDCPPQPCAS